MNVISRGIRNAFRNVTRTVALVVILGLSIGLALAMLIAHQAVGQKINSVKSSVGNTVSISPAGVRGFEGGGSALTETQLASVAKLAHVTALDESLSDRLTSTNTNLKSAVDAGSLGQRFSQNSGQSYSFSGGSGSGMGGMGGSGSSSGSVTTSFTPPVTVNGTTDPTNLGSSDTEGGGSFKLTSGKVFSSTSSDDVAVLGKSLASKNSLKVGSTFTAYNTTITVIGIYDAGNTYSNNQVIMPLATVQKLSSQSGAVTSAVATVDSVTNVSSVTSAISKDLGSSKADVTNSAQAAEQTIEPLKNIQTISLYSLIGAVIAGAAIILMTMIMIVRERRREIGVIKAIGASNLKVIGQFMSEAITLTILAAIVGTVIGAVAGSPITNTLVSNSSSSSSTTSVGGSRDGGGFGAGGGTVRRGLTHSLTNVHAAVGWDIILYGLVAAIVIAIVGSAIASFFIAKVRPAEVMRVE